MKNINVQINLDAFLALLDTHKGLLNGDIHAFKKYDFKQEVFLRKALHHAQAYNSILASMRSSTNSDELEGVKLKVKDFIDILEKELENINKSKPGDS